jgi:hypothetical protein
MRLVEDVAEEAGKQGYDNQVSIEVEMSLSGENSKSPKGLK